MGCHFPGKSNHSAAFWEFLNSDEDGVIPVPGDRWDWRKFTANQHPAEAGRSYLKEGGFLQHDIFGFDAAFFGISTREAETLDLQQRLLLEVAYQAIEDAGLCCSTDTAQAVGVFMGGFTLDNMVSRFSNLSRDSLESTDAMGSTMALLANRLSYSFNFNGPCLTLDTACSSSLVAVHLACESIRRGECAVALAGGVNVMLNAEASVMMSRGGFLSPTCRCHSFDSAADGYVRAEGAGVVVLKDYQQALADGDRIHALIRATGVCHDGKTAGMALPDSQAQQALMQSVCAQAGLEPGQLDYVEAHGTGTKAGDQAEIASIHNAYNSESAARAQPLVVGSVKSKFGHAEAAAGIAGLIKAVLVLKHGRVPAQLHFNQPSPDLKLEERGIVIPANADTCGGYTFTRAGINSFGYGGTNAHAIIEAADPRQQTNAVCDPAVSANLLRIVSLSARDKAALAALAGQAADLLEGVRDAAGLLDWAYSQTTRRARLSHALTVPFADREQMIRQLRAYSREGELSEGLFHRSAGQSFNAKGIVFVCTGMGPQWWGMGRSLYESSEAFRSAAQRCDAIFTRLAGWSILTEMLADEASSRMSKTEVAQPANAVLQIALAAVLEEAGVTPTVVVGHSVGEVTAAYLSGSLSLEDTICVAYHRSRLQQTLEGVGGMLAVGLSEAAMQPYLQDPAAAAVEIAAVNSPGSVTLAGPREALQQLDAQLADEQIFARMLQVEIPYHSSAMDPIRKDLRNALRGLQPQASRLPFVSTVTARVLDGEQLQAGYWWNNVRKPVRFQAAFEALLEDGYDCFVELGPHPVLRRSMQEIVQARGEEVCLVSTLLRTEAEVPRLQRALGELWQQGVDLPFGQYFAGGRVIDLPGYPFQRESLWRETTAILQDRAGRPDAHVFLQKEEVSTAEAWSVSLNRNYFPFLDDHVIQGTPLWPGAGFVESALALNLERNGGQAVTLSEISFQRMLPLNVSPSQQLITCMDADRRRWTVNSVDASDSNAWKVHAEGTLHEGLLIDVPPAVVPGSLYEAMEPLDAADYYRQLKDFGLEYGDCFRTIQRLYREGSTVVVELALDEGLLPEADRYQVHPALLDGAFQAFLLFANDAHAGTWIPVSVETLHFLQPVGARAVARVELSQFSTSKCQGSVTLYNDRGEPCLIVRGAVFRPLPAQSEQLLKDLYVTQLMPLKSAPMPVDAMAQGGWAVMVDGGAWAERLAALLAGQADVACHSLSDPSDWGDLAASAAQCIYIVDLQAADAIAEAIMGLVQCVQQAVRVGVPRLTLLTRGVYECTAGSAELNLANATATGLLSVLANEWPELELRLIDYQERLEDVGLTALLEELRSEIYANEICLAAQSRWHPVWTTAHDDFLQLPRTRRPLNPATETARLVPAHDQSLSGLCHVAEPRRQPAVDEVEIDVHCAGLNFKDLLKATGRIVPTATEDTFSGDTLGLECSGVVRHVGAAVDGLQVGDRVSAFSPEGCLGSRITVDAARVTRVDDAVSLEDAACVVPWVTAHYGLISQAHLAEGETVLVHSGAGGVGLAAIQVAHQAGAKVIASASSAAKRDYLLALGVFAVVDSSSLRFVEQVRACTHGKGVDVVLNALSGQALQQSFQLLSEGGRFIEIGKRDILENRALPMAVFNRNISFISVDLDRILKNDPGRIAGSVAYLWQGLRTGQLKALPAQAFPVAELSEAFKAMASRERIGRVNLAYDPEVALPVETVESVEVGADGCYLITGGRQGLGLAIAKEFASRGLGSLFW